MALPNHSCIIVENQLSIKNKHVRYKQMQSKIFTISITLAMMVFVQLKSTVGGLTKRRITENDRR